MTPETTALARELVGLPGFRWMPGILGASGIRYDAVDEQGRPYRVESRPVEWPGDCPEAHVYGRRGDVPDLDDPATVGCLLAMAREAWGCDAYRRLTLEPAGAGWCCILRNGRHRPPSRAHPGWDLDRVAHSRYRDVPSKLGDEFPTEVAALVAALKAAPSRST